MLNLSIPRFFGICILALGLAVAVLGIHVLPRFAGLTGDPGDRIWLMRGFGLGAIAVGIASLFEPYSGRRDAVGYAAVSIAIIGAFLAMAMQFETWWIDDAGITFSYSRTLAEGGGITFQPGEPPTEGYSSSLWMLVLAVAGTVGLDIPLAAKSLGIAIGVGIILLCLHLVWAQTKSLAAVGLTGVLVSTPPFVVWSVSGQEHALQSLLLVLVVYVVAQASHWRAWVTLLLALLVLVRPEAPLIVVAVFAALHVNSMRLTGRPEFITNLPIALVPFVTFCALIGWRLWYFGDPLPNPYYAKTFGSSVAGLVNPFGAGWQYILSGLKASLLVIIVPLTIIFAPARRDITLLLVLSAVVAGHLFFVVWAKGDWMGQYRFLMPVIPLIILPAVFFIGQIVSAPVRIVFCGVMSVLILINTISELDRFASEPTTPLSVVSEIGDTFFRVSQMIGIADPLLAHHDAGGIAYDRKISLVDLGGLVDRDIAKNMSNRSFLESYIFEQRKPDFIFGAINFAAASGFTQSPVFDRDYIPLVFENRPIMKSDLSHIRIEHARDVDGLRIERDALGQPVRAIFLAAQVSP